MTVKENITCHRQFAFQKMRTCESYGTFRKGWLKDKADAHQTIRWSATTYYGDRTWFGHGSRMPCLFEPPSPFDPEMLVKSSAAMQTLLNQDDKAIVTHEMGFAYEVWSCYLYGRWCYCRRRNNSQSFSDNTVRKIVLDFWVRRFVRYLLCMYTLFGEGWNFPSLLFVFLLF